MKTILAAAVGILIIADVIAICIVAHRSKKDMERMIAEESLNELEGA